MGILTVLAGPAGIVSNARRRMRQDSRVDA